MLLLFAHAAHAGLVAHWPLDDNAPSSSIAEVTGALPGTLTVHSDTLTFASGVAGTALDLGSADWIALPLDPRLTDLTAHTVSGWVRSEAVGGGLLGPHPFLSYSGTDSKRLDILGTDLSHSAGPGGSIRCTGSAWPESTWVHLVWVQTEAGALRLLVDGVEACPGRLYPAGPLGGSYTDISLGGDGAGLGFDAVLDDVQVYDHALGDCEIAWLRNHPGLALPDDSDSDGDGIDDAVDCCPSDAANDGDDDGICDDLDVCVGGDLSSDTDGDGICDDLEPLNHYAFDEGSGTMIWDSASVDHTCVQGQPAPTWTAGRFGDALDFDATGWVIAPGPGGPSFGMTIGFWVNATDWDGGDVPSPTLFNIDGTLWWEANWMGDNALNLKLLGAGDVGTIGNLPPEGEWHYLAFTYDGTTLTTFFDGEPTSTYPYAAGLPYSNLQFGCWSTLYYRFKGLQDEASLWDRALTRGEVAHAFQIGPFVTGNSAPGTCGDSDGDGLLDQDELLIHGTDPALADTDGDGLEDGEELDLGLDPTRADTDGDGVDDGTELAWGTDPLNPDTDGDGIEDGAEGATDSDGDGIIDALDDTDDTPDPATTDTEGSPDSTSKRSADDTGCGCATAKPAPAWIGLAIALLGLRRRRSPRCASSRLHLDGQRTRQPHAGAVIPQVHATAISRRAT